MKNIGFFVGRENFMNHARALHKSIINNTCLAQEYQIFMMAPDYLNSAMDIPGVNHHKFEVPEIYRSLPFIDKMFAAAAFENICPEGYIWLDVESYFLKHMEFSECAEILVNPVDKRNIGDSYGNELSTVWQIAYKYFQLNQSLSYVTTTVTKEEIYPYFNAGMIVVNKNKELFKTVKKSIEELLENDIIVKLMSESFIHKLFTHQVILSCAIIKIYGESIRQLPEGANYPLHLHNCNPTPISLEDLISIRYDDYFDSNSVPLIWANEFNDVRDGLKSNWYY